MKRHSFASALACVVLSKELNDEYRRRGGHWFCHYNGSASTYSLVGYALAEAFNKSK
jgi:hypothetical protein